jgi:cellobiose phosphorylase
VIRQLFGLRETADAWIFDPVLPMELDGIVLTWELCGKSVEVEYRVKRASSGAETIECVGSNLETTRESNPYRKGGLIVDKSVLEAALVSDSRLIISL